MASIPIDAHPPSADAPLLAPTKDVGSRVVHRHAGSGGNFLLCCPGDEAHRHIVC